MTPEAFGRGVDVLVLPQLGRRIRPWQDIAALVVLVRLLRRIRPTIVHTHTAKAGLLGRIAAVIAGVPIRVHTFHGHVMKGYFSPLRTRGVIIAERLLARITSRIVTVSKLQARELVDELRICPARKLQVLPLGFDFERFAPPRLKAVRGEFRAEIGAGDAPIIVVVGRLVPIKNHQLLLRAAERLAARGMPYVLAIVGGGPSEDQLRDLTARLGLIDRVRFLGWRSDLERIYADADVVALSSSNEGTPVCLIEALACGCAVIATDVGGVRDVLEEGALGTLVSPGDVDAFADGLSRLLTDSELRTRYATAAADSITERFAVDRLVRDMSALYDSLLTERFAANGAVLL